MTESGFDYENYLDFSFDDGFNDMDRSISRLMQCRDAADADNDLMYSVEIRDILIRMLYESDRLEDMMIELLWIAGKWEQNQENMSLSDGMQHFQRFCHLLPDFEGIDREGIFAAVEILHRWAGSESGAGRNLHFALYRLYSRMEEHTLAAGAFSVLEEAEKKGRHRFGYACEICESGRVIEYYSILGMLDEAMREARELLSRKTHYCASGPRFGLMYLLEALFDANRIEEVDELISFYKDSINIPTRAPLRAVIPLIRHHISQGNLNDARKLAEDSSRLRGVQKDRQAAAKFRLVQEQLGLNTPAHPCLPRNS